MVQPESGNASSNEASFSLRHLQLVGTFLGSLKDLLSEMLEFLGGTHHQINYLYGI